MTIRIFYHIIKLLYYYYYIIKFYYIIVKNFNCYTTIRHVECTTRCHTTYYRTSRLNVEPFTLIRRHDSVTSDNIDRAR